MPRKSRPFILFELIIALGLTAILLSVLFRFFASSLLMDRKIETARTALFQRQHFQTRMTTLFTSIVPRASTPPSTGSSFYTAEGKEIVAVFDNGIDPDPAFSGPILGKFFLDSDANLALALWPLEKLEKNLYRKEILLQQVQDIRFQFLAKKTAQAEDPHAIPINESLEWRTNWPKTRWDIPSCIRLIVRQNNQDIAFAFTLPFLEPIATYHHEGGRG